MENAFSAGGRHTVVMRDTQPAWTHPRPDPTSTWAAMYPDGVARCIGCWQACALSWVTWNTGLETVRLYACSSCRADEGALWRDAQLGAGRLRILRALSRH
jgi:hypothetical protein